MPPTDSDLNEVECLTAEMVIHRFRNYKKVHIIWLFYIKHQYLFLFQYHHVVYTSENSLGDWDLGSV